MNYQPKIYKMRKKEIQEILNLDDLEYKRYYDRVRKKTRVDNLIHGSSIKAINVLSQHAHYVKQGIIDKKYSDSTMKVLENKSYLTKEQKRDLDVRKQNTSKVPKVDSIDRARQERLHRDFAGMRERASINKNNPLIKALDQHKKSGGTSEQLHKIYISWSTELKRRKDNAANEQDISW